MTTCFSPARSSPSTDLGGSERAEWERDGRMRLAFATMPFGTVCLQTVPVASANIARNTGRSQVCRGATAAPWGQGVQPAAPQGAPGPRRAALRRGEPSTSLRDAARKGATRPGEAGESPAPQAGSPQAAGGVWGAQSRRPSRRRGKPGGVLATGDGPQAQPKPVQRPAQRFTGFPAPWMPRQRCPRCGASRFARMRGTSSAPSHGRPSRVGKVASSAGFTSPVRLPAHGDVHGRAVAIRGRRTTDL